MRRRLSRRYTCHPAPQSRWAAFCWLQQVQRFLQTRWLWSVSYTHLLEKEAVSAYHDPQDGSAVSRLERRKEFKDIAVELSYCRDVRNLLAHNQRIGESFAVEPSDAMIALMEETLEKVKNPVRCVDVWVPFNKMIWRTKKDNVLQTMQVMRSAGFSHVPILDNRRVTGVFLSLIHI